MHLLLLVLQCFTFFLELQISNMHSQQVRFSIRKYYEGDNNQINCLQPYMEPNYWGGGGNYHLPEFLKCISETLCHKIESLKTIKRVCGILCNIWVKWLGLCLPCQEMLSKQKKKSVAETLKHS